MNAIVQSTCPRRKQVYDWLCQRRSDSSPNGDWLARMLASWCVGEGALPDCLGLDPPDFQAMVAHFFADADIDGQAVSGRRVDFSRMLERQDLNDYLLRHAALADAPETVWLAGILVAGCLGEDHLWQDLGLWSRKDLSDLIAHNFPAVAARNTQDMKWKKFLYKQLCEAEDIYVCRAPSCDVCIDYPKCFGAEE